MQGNSRISYEDKPSDGTEGSIALKFYWVPLADVPTQAGGLDKMLPELLRSVKK